VDVHKLDMLSHQVTLEMNSGNYEEALRLINEMQSMKEDYLASEDTNRFLLNISGHLIDVGHALGRQQVIEEGIDLLKTNFERITGDEKLAVAYYDLANGYSALFDIRRAREPFSACFKDTELNCARSYYETALKYKIENQLFASQIWVNLGNCFDALGRVLDALECYDKAIALDKKHGMALGNKGVGLYSYARVAGEHQFTFLTEAYSLISEALKHGVNSEAAPHFQAYLEKIRKQFIGKEHVLENPQQYPGYTIKADSEIEGFLVKYCLDNKLYLNICNHCQRCDAAIGDTALIKKMIVPLNKQGSDVNSWPKGDKYLRLSAYVNQVKKDYVTARFFLMLSRYKGLNLDFVDKRVKIIDTLDYSIHNIYIELLKASFKGFYDILDKIAYFINDYLHLRIPERKIYFHTVWYEDSKDKKKRVNRGIQNTNSFSLNALFDMHRDFEGGEYKNLRLIRDALTHRFVNVSWLHGAENKETMSEDSLVELTLKLARATRNAIIYLLQFVYTEEIKNEKIGTGFIPTIYAQEVPDGLKG